MGTNFYIAGHKDDDRPEWHVGKRSAAGMFCWDCGVTLCKTGLRGIHKGDPNADNFLSHCPRCGQAPNKEKLSESTGGRELGFNTNPPKAKKGVATCCSFTWAMTEAGVKAKVKKIRKKRSDKVVVDEYGREFTSAEFAAVLQECPVRYNHFVGETFC